MRTNNCTKSSLKYHHITTVHQDTRWKAWHMMPLIMYSGILLILNPSSASIHTCPGTKNMFRICINITNFHPTLIPSASMHKILNQWKGAWKCRQKTLTAKYLNLTTSWPVSHAGRTMFEMCFCFHKFSHNFDIMIYVFELQKNPPELIPSHHWPSLITVLQAYLHPAKKELSHCSHFMCILNIR